MKIYLDDERVAPPGWVQVRWPEEVIAHLEAGNITDISLDHDLGDDEHGTGYDVILWIEKAVVTAGFRPPRIAVHSANISAREKMEAGIAAILRFAQTNEIAGNRMSLDDNPLKSVFGRSRVFLPVIHPDTQETALESIQTVVESGADGIFLINQGMSTFEVLDFISEVHRRHKDLWIGVNLLGTDPEDVIELIVDLPVGGIWSDNAGLNEQTIAQHAGEAFLSARYRTGWDGLYFGGVAFKYQRKVPDELLADAATKSCDWMDVITSSGPGTGHAASVEKVKALRSGAGSHPLALASGVSPENVASFLSYVDAYLVASEIETAKKPRTLVPERTKLLADRIHAWDEDL